MAFPNRAAPRYFLKAEQQESLMDWMEEEERSP